MNRKTRTAVATVGISLIAMSGPSVAHASTLAASTTLQGTTQLWVGLHGVAALRASLSHFPWPPVQEQLEDLVTRLADLNPDR